MSATAASVTTTLTYDPLGRLWEVQKAAVDTRFLYDGDAIIGEYDASGTLTNRYVHGSNLAADDPLVWYVGAGTGTKRYLHADHLGSIVAATNSGGAPTINAYDEYGVPKSGNAGRFQYTGQIWLTEIGLYHYKARLYSPYLGRFLQTDPVGYKDQFNLYVYVADDPVNGTDSTGLGPIEPPPSPDCKVAHPSGKCLGPRNPMTMFGQKGKGGGSKGTGRKCSKFCPTGETPFYFNGKAWPEDPLYEKPAWSNWFDACFAVCPVLAGAALAVAPAAILTAAEAAGTETSATELTLTFGHGARHLAGSGLSQGVVERAIAGNVRGLASRGLLPEAGWFQRTIQVGGKTIEYRGYVRENDIVNIGTYFIP